MLLHSFSRSFSNRELKKPCRDACPLLTYPRILRGLSSDPKLLELYESGFLPKLDVFEGILAKQKYMGGDEFSLIDIYYFPYTQKLFEVGYGHFITDRPHVKAWWERVSGRESWQKVLALP